MNKYKIQLEHFLRDCDIRDVKNKKILEIGFKNGYFLNECCKIGLTAIGTEVVEEYCADIKKKFPNIHTVLCKGDKIPLEDNSVDFIVSFQVVEHIDIPGGMAGITRGIDLSVFLKDLIRILKPGGIMYHCCPNYNSFYEGHYKILWLPFLNKTTGRWYLKLLKKDTKEFDLTVDPIKPKKIKKIVKNIPNAKLISLGKKEFLNNLNQEQINLIGNKFLRTFFTIVKKVGVLYLLAKIISLFNFYYPLVVIIKKNGKI